MGYAPKLLIDGPAVIARPHNLASVISWREGVDTHWQNGIELDPLFGDGAGVHIIGDPDCETEIVKEFDGTGDAVSVEPFTAYAGLRCGAVGTTTEGQQAIARERLLALESHAIGLAVFSSTPSVSPSLSDISASSASAVTAADALAVAEREFAQLWPGQGIVLLSADAAVDVAGYIGDELTRTGQRYAIVPELPESTVVLVPYLEGVRSEVIEAYRFDALLDPTMNFAYGIAERTYVLAFDPEASVKVSYGSLD